MCCFNGSVVLPEISQPTELIKNLLKNKDFQDIIQGYNCALSLTSLGVDLDERYCNNRTGTYAFSIHGSVVPRIGSLFPKNNTKPKIQQILFHDTDNELDNRLFNLTV